jgi:branched-chain amino acid transport system ATP-binding protein
MAGPGRRLSRSGYFARFRAASRAIGLADRASAAARDLSHGERRQLELAMALAGGPRLILLDEPMAGMGGQDSAGK